MRLNPFFLPGLAITLFFGTVLSAQAAGIWSTSGRDATVLETLTPADVKGWMTLRQVSDGLPIPLDALYALMEIPADIPPETALKDLEPVVPGFEVSVLRDRLTAWQADATAVDNAPVATPAPPTATPAPQPAATATPVPEAPTAAAEPSPAHESTVELTCDVRGRTTVQEAADACGVAFDALLAAAGLPADTAPETAVKDLVSQGRLTDIDSLRVAVATVQAQP